MCFLTSSWQNQCISEQGCQSFRPFSSVPIPYTECMLPTTKQVKKAVEHGCAHEKTAIQEYELRMKQNHTNFKVKRCGLVTNKDYPWLHVTPDFLCCCGFCGKAYGEVKCPLCLENSDFETYCANKYSCLRRDSSGNYTLPIDHQYYYSLEASGKNRTFLYSLTRFNMADHKQRVPKLIGESADQHLPPLKEKK